MDNTRAGLRRWRSRGWLINLCMCRKSGTCVPWISRILLFTTINIIMWILHILLQHQSHITYYTNSCKRHKSGYSWEVKSTFTQESRIWRNKKVVKTRCNTKKISRDMIDTVRHKTSNMTSYTLFPPILHSTGPRKWWRHQVGMLGGNPAVALSEHDRVVTWPW